MTVSLRSFDAGLFEEHLEDAAFLYRQHLVYLHDPELRWVDLDGIEQRFEAHIDALVVGGEHALAVAKGRCAGGDFGELHAATRVFCRQGRAELVYAVLQGMDADNARVTQAVADALQAECPPAWHDDLVRIMLGARTELAPVLAAVLAYRRVPIEDALLRVLGAANARHLPLLLTALGKVGTERALAALATHLRSDDPAVAEAACRALTRLGDGQAVRHALLVGQLRPWPAVVLGVAGDQSAVGVLSEIVRGDKATDDALVALGLLGDVRGVAAIFQCLAHPERAPAAAAALALITGAGLEQQVFVPDAVDPDELFAEERKKYAATGEAPKRSDGQPFGSNIVQTSTEPERWRSWLGEHKAEFDPRLPYRHGQPLSPRATLASLEHPQTPNRVRALLCEELAVRYRAPVTLEIDMPVREQHRQLAKLAQWVDSDGRKFTPGMRYFAGRPSAPPANA